MRASPLGQKGVPLVMLEVSFGERKAKLFVELMICLTVYSNTCLFAHLESPTYD